MVVGWYFTRLVRQSVSPSIRSVSQLIDGSSALSVRQPFLGHWVIIMCAFVRVIGITDGHVHACALTYVWCVCVGTFFGEGMGVQ